MTFSRCCYFCHCCLSPLVLLLYSSKLCHDLFCKNIQEFMQSSSIISLHISISHCVRTCARQSIFYGKHRLVSRSACFFGPLFIHGIWYVYIFVVRQFHFVERKNKNSQWMNKDRFISVCMEKTCLVCYFYLFYKFSILFLLLLQMEDEE